jgi:hypothetical protein
MNVLNSTMSDEIDKILSFLSYKLLDRGSTSDNANDWWKISCARILYPKANMNGQRLSEFFVRLGSEELWRKF